MGNNHERVLDHRGRRDHPILISVRVSRLLYGTFSACQPCRTASRYSSSPHHERGSRPCDDEYRDGVRQDWQGTNVAYSVLTRTETSVGVIAAASRSRTRSWS